MLLKSTNAYRIVQAKKVFNLESIFQMSIIEAYLEPHLLWSFFAKLLASECD